MTDFTFSFYKNNNKIIEQTYKMFEKEKNIYRFSLFDYETILDLNDKTLSRENEDFLFLLDFDKELCEINLKKENITLPIQVDYCICKDNKDIFELEYSIETEDTQIKLVINKNGKEEE